MKTVNADELKKELSKAPVWTAIAVKEMIDEMTNTQVRCKECKWLTKDQYDEPYCGFHSIGIYADDFCSYGVKKGADDE